MSADGDVLRARLDDAGAGDERGELRPGGLGDRGGPCTVEIRWPSGATQRLEGTAVDQALVLREPAVNADEALGQGELGAGVVAAAGR